MDMVEQRALLHNFKISVIIPVYNTEKYLNDCLNSVINQTLKEIEIICINDGSTDSSLKILQQYSNIQIISQSQQGLSNVRNLGLSKAKGKYILFLDSDDYLELNALENLFNFAENNALNVVYFDGISFFENKILKTKFPEYINAYQRTKDYGIQKNGLEMALKMIPAGDYYPSSCLQLFNKKYLQSLNIQYTSNLLYEDFLFNFQLIMLANKVGHLHKQLYHRRIRDNSIVTDHKNRAYKLQSLIYIYNEMLKYSDFLKETSYSFIFSILIEDILLKIEECERSE